MSCNCYFVHTAYLTVAGCMCATCSRYILVHTAAFRMSTHGHNSCFFSYLDSNLFVKIMFLFDLLIFNAVPQLLSQANKSSSLCIYHFFNFLKSGFFCNRIYIVSYIQDTDACLLIIMAFPKIEDDFINICV